MANLVFCNRLLRLACAAWLALALAACGGRDDDPPPARMTIGPAGGTVATASGAQVVIPPGAPAALTTIAIERSTPVVIPGRDLD